MKDIALFRLPVTSAPDKKIIEGGMATRRVETDSCRELGKGPRDEKSWEAAKETRPGCETSHDTDTVTNESRTNLN
jgi:hypothetical protein